MREKGEGERGVEIILEVTAAPRIAQCFNAPTNASFDV